jgi:hypothetical protein
VVVAVTSVGVVQMPLDEIVLVVAVRNGLVPACGPVYVAIVVAGAAMGRRACRGVLVTHGDDALVDVVAMKVVQMAVVQVVGMPVMLNGFVAATGAVAVGVIGVRSVLAHRVLLRRRCSSGRCVSAGVDPVKRCQPEARGLAHRLSLATQATPAPSYD